MSRLIALKAATWRSGIKLRIHINGTTVSFVISHCVTLLPGLHTCQGARQK